jgi:polygalacturonase
LHKTSVKWALISLPSWIFVFTVTAHAQDLRTVTEPVIPPVCTTLTAALAQIDETKLDTSRIQQALDRCPAGRAVELKPDASRNTFLSGPLELRRGVTLLVDRGITLFASRDPRQYDVRPGSCGIVDQNGRGCKPLLHGDRVEAAAVMGDGVIDARGAEKLLGQDVTWWDLAEQARAHMTIAHNHFYSGHGMSIGSETNGGASAIRVADLSITGADNGIRIKSNSSRGGLVQDIVYEDVCIQDTKNPILMDTHYSFRGAEQDKLPEFRDIVLRNVRILGAGKITLDGFDAAHRLGMTFDNVTLDTPASIQFAGSFADLTFGPGPVNFRPQGQAITITPQAQAAKAAINTNSCDGKFVAFPAR